MQDQERTMSTVYGKVYNNVTKAVITSGASVAAPPYTVTNNQGAYTFATPGAATVDVTASATGFTPKTTSVSVAAGQNKKVDFYLDPI